MSRSTMFTIMMAGLVSVGAAGIAADEHYVGMGCRMALAGSDYSFLMAAAAERAKFLRGMG